MADSLKVALAQLNPKVGDVAGNLAKVRRALEKADRLSQAIYAERATLETARILPFTELASDAAPYFATILIPSSRGQC